MSTYSDYEYTGVKLPRDIKKQVRSIAADRESNIAKTALYLIELGITVYKWGPGCEPKEAPCLTP